MTLLSLGKKLIYYLILVFSLGGCVQNHFPSLRSPIFFDSSIKNDLENLHVSLCQTRRPMALISFSPQKTPNPIRETIISNGWQLVEFHKKSQGLLVRPKTQWDYRFESEYLPCYHVALLQKANSATQSYFPTQNLKKLLREMSRSLASEEAKKEFTNNQLTLTSDDYYQTYFPVAAADFTGDGIEDILCDYVEQSRQGTAFLVTPIYLIRTEPKGDIVRQDINLTEALLALKR